MKSWLLALVALVLMTGCQPFWQSDNAVSEDPAMLLPSGWHWESYGGIEVGVPDSWKWGTTDRPWCLEKPAGPPTPYAGRPGVVPAIGCMATPGQVSDPSSTRSRKPGRSPGSRSC